MNRVDIMVDIETLGTKSDSTIFQIAAIAFDIETGKFLSTFNMAVDISKNKTPLIVDGDTLKWWLKTDKELFTELLHNGEKSSEDVLKSFHYFLKSHQSLNGSWKTMMDNVYLWGNGILFDNKMIQHQFEMIGLEYPIYYRNDRDVRTIVELASKRLGMTEKELKEKWLKPGLVKHNALDDVIQQIELVVKCHSVLVG